MAITKEHELHKRRARRNLFVGLMLFGFVAMVFGITMVKLSDATKMRAYQGTASDR